MTGEEREGGHAIAFSISAWYQPSAFSNLARVADHDRVLAEQHIDLAPVLRRVEIALDPRVAEARAVVARVGTRHAQHALEIGDLVCVPHAVVS
jgi:hypothetical protein